MFGFAPINLMPIVKVFMRSLPRYVILALHYTRGGLTTVNDRNFSDLVDQERPSAILFLSPPGIANLQLDLLLCLLYISYL